MKMFKSKGDESQEEKADASGLSAETVGKIEGEIAAMMEKVKSF